MQLSKIIVSILVIVLFLSGIVAIFQGNEGNVKAGRNLFDEGLVAYWKMDEDYWDGTTGEVIDASGNENNGTASNDANTINGGISGRAGYFDGVDDCVEIPHSDSLNVTTEITMEAWVYWNGPRNTTNFWDCQRIISKKGTETHTQETYTYWIHGGTGSAEDPSLKGCIAVRFDAEFTPHEDRIVFNTSIQENKWYHLVVTYNGTTTNLFVNGIQFNETRDTHGGRKKFSESIVSSTENLLIGAALPPLERPFNGTIDEVRIYNRTLNSSEILSHFEEFAPVHNLDTNEYFTTIQRSIDDSDTLNGHTIFVKNGTYYENVVVNKTIDLIGNGNSSTIIDGGGTSNVVYVSADYVNISNFTLTNGNWCGIYSENVNNLNLRENLFKGNIGDGILSLDSKNLTIVDNNITLNGGSGIELWNPDSAVISHNSISLNILDGMNISSAVNCTIINNFIWNNSKGIFMYNYPCKNNLISGNNIKSNNGCGILFENSNNAKIQNCNISSNNFFGLDLYNSNGTEIINCTIVNNSGGVHFPCSPFTTIKNCNIENNHYTGINTSVDSNHSTVINCKIYNHTEWGIFLAYCSDFVISDCEINNNFRGIAVWPCENSTITSCQIEANYYGIYIRSGDGIGGDDYNYLNELYHNNFHNNIIQSFDEETNHWENGYPSGGNYWSDFDEPSEGAWDNNSDGIVDSPYDVPGGSNQDLYPLMHPWYSSHPDVVYADDDYTSSTSGWGYDHFGNIQDGINEVAENGTVYVYDGTYYENIVVNKTVNIFGEGMDNVVIDGKGNDTIVINASAVHLRNLTLRDSLCHGMIIEGAHNVIETCHICDIEGSCWGLSCGIWLLSPYNTIHDCIIHDNNCSGIIISSSNNTLSSCNIFNNTDGIYLGSSRNNTLMGNHITNNTNDGIFLGSSSDNNIKSNIISSNAQIGIELSYSNSNIMSGNDILNNNYGLGLGYSDNNTITCNIVSNNNYGAGIAYSNDNIFYHNTFNNSYNAYDFGGNTWDNDYPSGGNYWSNYTGIDTNGDGIGETPYNISGGENQDRYPFVNPLISMRLSQGWNLITVPFNNSWTAETLGKNISDCNVVSMFNASTQTFITHVVGAPHDNFPVENGIGYFVYVTIDSVFVIRDVSIASITVSIEEDWNLIGWCHETTTTAESLGQEINGTTVVVMFNSSTQTFLTHVVGTPHDNFIIECGMGLFIYTSESSMWHGEG